MSSITIAAPARRLHVLIQPHHVRVIQRGQHRRLSPEQLRELRIGQQLTVQVLDRHRSARRVMPGQHHVTEPARAQRLHPGITRDIPLSRHQVPTHRPPTLNLASGRRQSPPRAPARPASGPGKPPPDDRLSMKRAQLPCQSPDRGQQASRQD